MLTLKHGDPVDFRLVRARTQGVTETEPLALRTKETTGHVHRAIGTAVASRAGEAVVEIC